ncbi:thioredoxin-like protein [Suillus ampliporus]|nr:thioredoxin-like protein [Suillus ampliporus]
MAPHPLINKPAPEFSIPHANGHMFKFPPEEQGRRVNKPIALCFYPESGTLACSREACQFRDALVENAIFKRTEVQVIGISPDPVPKQKQFVESQHLTYPVLSDEKHIAHKTFQVGKGFLGLTDARTTFVIDRDGIIRDSLSSTMIYTPHIQFVAEALEKLVSQPFAQSSAERHDTNSSRSDDQSTSPSRDELGRVAYVVSA